jgi:hypothetical protein
MAEQQLADTIQDVFQELVVSDANVEKIPEDFFVKVFLPMFAGDKEAMARVTPEMWFNLAKGPFNEVAVIDGRGTELFRVPPFYSQKVIKPLDGTGKAAHMPTIADVVKSANNHAFRGPGLGDAYLSQELAARSFMFDPDADVSDDNRRWGEIFARYKDVLASRGITVAQPKPTGLNPTPTNVDIARDSTEFDSLC